MYCVALIRFLVKLVCFQAYDQHLNIILGEVEETITTIEIDDETYEEIIKVRKRLFNQSTRIVV